MLELHFLSNKFTRYMLYTSESHWNFSPHQIVNPRPVHIDFHQLDENANECVPKTLLTT